MSTQKTVDWIALNGMPNECVWYTKPLRLNHNEFIVIPGNTGRNNAEKGIYKYNTEQSKWHLIFKYPEEMKRFYCQSAAMDKEYGLLYIYTNNNKGELYQIDLIKKTYKLWNNVGKFGMYSSATIINNRFHLISGENYNHHSIWDENNETFHEIATFDDKIGRHGLITYKTNKLLLFGGYSSYTHSVDRIYKFDESNNKWILLTRKMNERLHEFGHVLTVDERYIIMFGGWCSAKGRAVDDIYIFDIMTQNFDIKKSSIRCPVSSKMHAIIMEGAIKNKNKSQLVFGFVYQIIHRKINYFSKDLIHLIIKFMSDSYVYLMCLDTNKLWKIHLNDLFT